MLRLARFSSLKPSNWFNNNKNNHARLFSSSLGNNEPWSSTMPEEQFERMKKIIGAPSPIGLEGAMTFGVLEPLFQDLMNEYPSTRNWSVHKFKGNAGIVVDTQPDNDEMFSLMIIGHADKIRMQVRSIGEDGKIWINSDSFLPLTLLGNEVTLFSDNPESPGDYRSFQGGTIEALGAIHFADPSVRTGKTGIKPEQLYLELHLHGEKRKEQVKKLGIRPGDPILLNRLIRPGFARNTFQGAYLDNGLGCFVTAEVARLVASKNLKNVRCLFAFASHEEIGRFGSRVLAGKFRPDATIAVDVNHDYNSAPGIGHKRFQPLELGKGFTYSTGAIASESLNNLLERAAISRNIPFQRDVCGADTGTDAMAGVLSSVDTAATSVGFPIRNMHTISEAGHTGDVLAAIHAVTGLIEDMGNMESGDGIVSRYFKDAHPRLDDVHPITQPDLSLKDEDQVEKNAN